MFSALARFAVNNRRRLPNWAQNALNSVTGRPDSLVSRIATFSVRGPAALPTAVPHTPIRVYIGSTNYAGQGFQWARSLERADANLAARNVAVRVPGGFTFPADTSVSMWESNYSRSWAQAEWEQAKQFTHVLIEAERPLFGTQFNRNLRAEAQGLREAGVRVAFLSHGTDIRIPARHIAAQPLSPYLLDTRTPQLAEQAAANLALLADLDGVKFVSTPDLLEDLPDAIWCPVVVDASRFQPKRPPALEGRPRIIHISSDSIQKGSDLVIDAVSGLEASGAVDFELIEGVPSAEVPAILDGADIVLDQFRLGSYGVAACEALAAGRIVIGNVSDQVRDSIRLQTGLDLPIIQAVPTELPRVIERILSDPIAYSKHAELGPKFIGHVHSGSMSAAVLLNHWIKAEGS